MTSTLSVLRGTWLPIELGEQDKEKSELTQGGIFSFWETGDTQTHAFPHVFHLISCTTSVWRTLPYSAFNCAIPELISGDRFWYKCFTTATSPRLKKKLGPNANYHQTVIKGCQPVTMSPNSVRVTQALITKWSKSRWCECNPSWEGWQNSFGHSGR